MQAMLEHVLVLAACAKALPHELPWTRTWRCLLVSAALPAKSESSAMACLFLRQPVPIDLCIYLFLFVWLLSIPLSVPVKGWRDHKGCRSARAMYALGKGRSRERKRP